MTKEQYALDYQHCDVGELEAFIKARTGKDPAAERAKEYYVHKLHKLDHKARFRFFDLAPELRNLMYRELLVGDATNQADRRRGNCVPQILATCKLAHREATDILYTDNIPDIRLTAEVCEDRITCSTAVGQSLDRELADTACLEYVGWGAHLRRFARLAVVVVIRTVPGAHENTIILLGKCINNLLYSLVNDLLAGSEKLEALEVRVQGGLEGVEDPLYLRMLWPLTKLGGQDIAITIRQLKRIRSENSSLYPGNLVQRYWLLEDKTKRHYGVHRKTDEAWDTFTAVGIAAQQLEDLAMGDEYTYTDEKWEGELVDVMQQLEDALLWGKASDDAAEQWIGSPLGSMVGCSRNVDGVE
ncbi:hypothetical protein LTR36_009318 [Oleoguttula mirabilis]|uniref:Uncharacterized protein n=1 Tax=Oleoguttula mirabilis TaxID=1507867 RepID=A0AAV9J6Q4_9PEZI|nr:hypothetical protein LTR36_009318 [Oleoguttula mirabilis]